MGIRTGSNIHLVRKRQADFSDGVLHDGILVKSLRNLLNTHSPMEFGNYLVLSDENRISVYQQKSLTGHTDWDSTIAKCLGSFSITDDEIKLDTYEAEFFKPAKFLYDLIHELKFKSSR